MKEQNWVVSRRTAGRMLGLAVLAAAVPALGQGFSAGSDGSLGDVVIAADTTIALPPDGKLHYKSLQIAGGVRVTFTRNQRNTPVYILSQGDVVVNPGAVIDIRGGRGNAASGGVPGPGGFGGGQPGFSDTAPGAGFGPGGAQGGLGNCGNSNDAGGGSFGDRQGHTPNGQPYGNSFLIPLIGGSGGGGLAGSPGQGGGGGGGAILIAASTKITVNGTIDARGGGNSSCLNGGSGGGIRLVAFRVEGSGLLDVRPQGSGGGNGRIRVDTIERNGIGFNFQGVSSVGGNLFTFSPVEPKLETIEVAGNVIPDGTFPAPFTLPFGSTPQRTVKIRARDFGKVVPIRLTLTPDSGARVVVDTEIDNTAANPAVLEIPVTVPVNTLVTIHCWTR